MYRALISFSGQISMMEGEVREISDPLLLSDLLNAKYIEEVKEESKKEVKEEVKEEKPKKPAKRKATGK